MQRQKRHSRLNSGRILFFDMLKLALRYIVNQSEHFKISQLVDTISTIFMTRAVYNQCIVSLNDNIGKRHTSGNLDCHGKTSILGSANYSLQQVTNEVLRETLQTRGTPLLPVLSASSVF